jgi:hypothetical protein
VGLIAREIEGRGIPTCSLTSALSITEAVRPPRAVHVDFPLGHTAGKAGQPELQTAIVSAALEAFETLEAPGGIVRLPYAWDENDGGVDAWKQRVLHPDGEESAADERSARNASPQYQNEADREAAERAQLEGEGCPGCVWVE